MKHNFSTLVLICVIANLASAETLFLGEFQGTAPMQVQYVGAGGGENEYLSNCKMAYNLSLDSQSMDIDFGVVTCDHGQDFWNEKPVSLTISGATVYKDGVQVGVVEPGGAVSFEISSYQMKTFEVIHYNESCQPSSFEIKKIKVGSLTKFRIHKLSDSSFSMSRSEQQSDATKISKKQWANCPAYFDYVSTNKLMNFDVLLSR